jgi:hypothetical protein
MREGFSWLKRGREKPVSWKVRSIYPSPTKILLSSLAFSHWKKLPHLPIGTCYSSVQKLPPMKKCFAVIPVPSLARGISFTLLS